MMRGAAVLRASLARPYGPTTPVGLVRPLLRSRPTSHSPNGPQRHRFCHRPSSRQSGRARRWRPRATLLGTQRSGGRQAVRNSSFSCTASHPASPIRRDAHRSRGANRSAQVEMTRQARGWSSCARTYARGCVPGGVGYTRQTSSRMGSADLFGRPLVRRRLSVLDRQVRDDAVRVRFVGRWVRERAQIPLEAWRDLALPNSEGSFSTAGVVRR